jgi:glutamate synthase domain-containing protein 2
VRDAAGELSVERVREIAPHVRAFEIKLSQGAKPGKGGILPGAKVTEEIAAIRGIAPHRDSISPNRHRDIADAGQLLDQIARLRDLTGKPVGVKTAIGDWEFVQDLCEAVQRRGVEWAPDFLVIDGGEGGTGAAPQALMDHMALSIAEALPRVVDGLIEWGLRGRIKVVASGKLVTSAKAAWALCAGADFINSARGFMFALGCIQALRCHTNTCPTGITTHNRRLQRGLVVEEKYLRVANYVRNMNKEIELIAHSCGLRHARELRREHVRIVRNAYESVALNMLCPYPQERRRMPAVAEAGPPVRNAANQAGA